MNWITGDETDTTVPPIGDDETGGNAPPPKISKAISGAKAQLQDIQGRISEITEKLEGTDTWNKTQVTELRQEVADLKATMAELSSGLSSSSQLREQLTQTQQEVQTLMEQVSKISPPVSQNLPQNNAPPVNVDVKQEAPIKGKRQVRLL